MKIDFTFSIEDWMAVIQQFIMIIQNFFAELGLKFFDDSTTVPTEEATTL